MSAALIVIEVAAPDVSEDSLPVLVAACTRAARAATCVLTKDESEEQPSAVAIVSQQANNEMRVEVGVRQSGHDSWRSKDFSFSPADRNLDRWRAIGFAIGTLAESSPPPDNDTAAALPPSAMPPFATPPKAPPPRPKAPPHSGAQLFLGAAAVFAPGLMNDSWKLGSALYADLSLPRVPLFFVVGGSAATGLGANSNGASARWFDLALGAGFPFLGRMQSSGLDLGAQFVCEYFDVGASTAGRSQSSSRLTVGIQGVFGVRLQIVPGLLFTADARGAAYSGSSKVTVRGIDAGENEPVRYLFTAGLRVRLR